MAGKLIKHVFEGVTDFNLDQIFGCGQCFRWNKEEDGSYTGVIEGSFANVNYHLTDPNKHIGTLSIVSNYLTDQAEASVKYWRKYFDLDRDYGAIKKRLCTEDPVMTKAIRVGRGIRILYQNKWEILITFIISQNNNIPRIKSCIEKLCTQHGDKIGAVKGKVLYAFPTIEKLAALQERDIEECKLGYRARYIIETARQIAYDDGLFLETGDKMPTEQVDRYLRTLSGVGPKVANCIMLFSMGKMEVFPIDVWVKRVMNRLYGMGEENISAIKDYASRNYGEFGGFAQQCLFYYIREMLHTNPVLYKRLDFDRPFEQSS